MAGTRRRPQGARRRGARHLQQRRRHPDGQRFVGHLTLARLHRSTDARKWLQVLDTFRSAPWWVDDIELIESHLREGPAGRPRYETVASLSLGTT